MKYNMSLKNKIITHPDGTEYHILAAKIVSDGKRNICLLTPVEKHENDYSLWYFEDVDDKYYDYWPYKGDDSENLLIELLEYFVETALDEF